MTLFGGFDNENSDFENIDFNNSDIKNSHITGGSTLSFIYTTSVMK